MYATVVTDHALIIYGEYISMYTQYNHSSFAVPNTFQLLHSVSTFFLTTEKPSTVYFTLLAVDNTD